MQIAEQQEMSHEEAYKSLKLGDEVSVYLQGQNVNLTVTSMEGEIFGKLANGMMGIDIQDAYNTLSPKDFRISNINGIKVLPPCK